MKHLQASINWIITAQKHSGSKGISLAYSMKLGWLPAYPETTGYIINTFIEYYKFTNNEYYLNKAIELGNWEMDIQLPSGGTRVQHPDNTQADIFDTGMVLLGLTDLYKETKDKTYYDAACKAGDWLTDVQDNDGKWSTYSYKMIPHTYHSKVAWALFKLYNISGDEKYKIAAEKNLGWIFSIRYPNGWYDYMGFDLQEQPYSHTVAYILQGFWGAYVLMDNQNPLKAKLYSEIVLFSDRIIDKYGLQNEKTDMNILPGTFTNTWEAGDEYVCLTGNTQFSIVWYELYMLTDNEKYYTAATNLLNVVKKTQKMDGPDLPYKNAIAGSYPIWGNYHPNEYPNWAAKFFADALMLKIKIDTLKDLN
ncbi:MAG: glycoside hydrolase family 127 protein [Bacteroidetes bacterium]|nr:glycoside hydrolase family 127 protein [Bacteroidota bacterium]